MLEVDLHIHTIHSGHAYGTLYDVIKEAKNRNMKVIGINDHGPDMKGSAPEPHFLMGPRSPDFGIEVLWGCEANVLNEKGDTDLPSHHIDRLDYASLALHRYCSIADMGSEKNTEALIKAMNNPKIKFLSHPCHQNFPIDYEKVWEAAIEKGLWLEINLSYIKKHDSKKIEKMIEFGKNRGAEFIVNSDAHFVEEIGLDTPLERLEVDLNKKRTINEMMTPSNAQEILKNRI